MVQYNELLELLESTKKDFEKFFDGGNKAAGTRIRVAMQALKSHAQDIRVGVTQLKKEK